MTEKKDLWLVFLLGLITCGIYNIVVAISALKNIYKIKGEEEAFGKRIVIWIVFYSVYFIFTVGINIVQVMGAVMAETYSYGTEGALMSVLGSLGGMFITFVLWIISMVLYYHEFDILTQVSNDYGIKTTPGYKMACILLGAASFQIASLLLQGRLNKLIDLQNVQTTNTSNQPTSQTDGGSAGINLNKY